MARTHVELFYRNTPEGTRTALMVNGVDWSSFVGPTVAIHFDANSRPTVHVQIRADDLALRLDDAQIQATERKD